MEIHGWTVYSSWQLERAGTERRIKSAFAPQLRPHKAITKGGWETKAFPPHSWCKGWKLLNSQLCYFFWPSSPFQQMPLLAGPRCLALFSMLLSCFFTRAEMLLWPRCWEGTKQQHRHKLRGKNKGNPAAPSPPLMWSSLLCSWAGGLNYLLFSSGQANYWASHHKACHLELGVTDSLAWKTATAWTWQNSPKSWQLFWYEAFHPAVYKRRTKAVMKMLLTMQVKLTYTQPPYLKGQNICKKSVLPQKDKDFGNATPRQKFNFNLDRGQWLEMKAPLLPGPSSLWCEAHPCLQAHPEWTHQCWAKSDVPW